MGKRSGRPTKLTPEVSARICDAISVGATREKAAWSGGINKATIYDWMKRGEAEDGIYSDFADAVKRSEADCVGLALRTIRGAMESGQWQAAAWILERKYPADYGRNRTGLENDGGSAKSYADALRDLRGGIFDDAEGDDDDDDDETDGASG